MHRNPRTGRFQIEHHTRRARIDRISLTEGKILLTINPYESGALPVNSETAGSEDAAPPTLRQRAADWLSLSIGCVFGAYAAVAMTDGMASAMGRGIPPLRLFAPVFAIAIATTGMWRWLRFRNSSAYAFGPIAKFMGGAFATCSTFLVMTQLEGAHLADAYLPWLHLPLFVIACVIAVEVEGSLRLALKSPGMSG